MFRFASGSFRSLECVETVAWQKEPLRIQLLKVHRIIYVFHGSCANRAAIKLSHPLLLTGMAHPPSDIFVWAFPRRVRVVNFNVMWHVSDRLLDKLEAFTSQLRQT
jgi:hypothetical protein